MVAHHLYRDLSVEEAVELGQRSIFHATFRDAVSGGTASGMQSLLLCYANIKVLVSVLIH